MKNNPQKKVPTQAKIQRQEIIYTGPIPPPSVMARLEDVLPGAADRIFKMAEADQQAAHLERQQAHSRAEQAEKHTHKENITALWMAFSICLIFAVGGIVLVFQGFEKIGSALIGTTLLGVVASFLSRNPRKK